jgi:hypothetical protein
VYLVGTIMYNGAHYAHASLVAYVSPLLCMYAVVV